MRTQTRLRAFDGLVLLTLLAIVALLPGPLHAQSLTPGPEGIKRGDAVVTGFAGTLPPGPDLPVEVHPLDRTAIDVEGVTVRVFDLSQLGGGPEGQLSDARLKMVLKAKDVGHVFGVAFDGDGMNGPPNIYLTASSAHGLQLVAPGADGRLERVMTGRPGALWMTGVFGDRNGGGPGSIWKVDGRTGAVTLFADIKTGDLENSGAGLGAIAFDARSRQFYVSDLETGLIWRLGLDGQLIDAFDHGSQARPANALEPVAYDPADRTDRTQETFNTENPATWGFAPAARRVWGLAVEKNRLYYAVAEGPTIWSVGLNPDGGFADDARAEITVKGIQEGSQIGTILFDGPNVMHLAQRGGLLGSYDYTTFMRPQEASALRYGWDDQQKAWLAEPQQYAVGMPPDHHGVVGGVALNYGYDRFGRIDYGRCRQTVWHTGEQLRAGTDIVRVTRGGPRLVSGLQGIYKSRVRPDNEPPYEAWFVDFDANYDDEDRFGHVGNVAIFAPCEAQATYSAEQVEIPVWTSGPNIVVEKRCEAVGLGGKVRCVIVARNIGDGIGDGFIDIFDETRILFGPGAGGLLPVALTVPDGPEWVCSVGLDGKLACKLPAALLAPGGFKELVVWVDTLDLVLGGNIGFRNCVAINHPAGIGKACAEGGVGLIFAKTGPAVCEPEEDCTFKLTLTNASTSPFKGEVVIADHMMAGGKPVKADIMSIKPALACKAKPGSLPFSCVAEVSLAPGQSLTHEITVEMPKAGPAFVQNCFAVIDPLLAAKPDALAQLFQQAAFKGFKVAAGGGAHPACLWVKLDDPDKVLAPAKKSASTFVPTTGLLPPPFVCADGQPPRAGGRCPCPLNAPWDPETRSCRWQPVCWDKARLTPSGQCCPRGTVWWAASRACRVPPVTGCTDVWRRTPDGGCCPRGSRWIDGACRQPVVEEPCREGFVRLISGVCIPRPVIPPIVVPPRCPDGRPRLANGRCPPVACPLGVAYNARTGRCDPGHGGDKGGTQCGPGQRLIRGRCIGTKPPVVTPPKPDRPIVCPGRLVPDGRGRCVPPGKVDGGKPGSETSCGPGQRRVGGRCVGGKPPPVVKPPVVRPPVVRPPIVRPPVVRPRPPRPPIKVRPRPDRPPVRVRPPRNVGQPPGRVIRNPGPPRLGNPGRPVGGFRPGGGSGGRR